MNCYFEKFSDNYYHYILSIFMCCGTKTHLAPILLGMWGHRTKEYLEQVKCCHDTDCNEPMMKKGFTALKFGTWEVYKETFRKKMNASERAFDRIEDAVRRALLLPFEERADGPQGAGSVWAQHPAAWRASLLFDSEEAGICARQRGLNSSQS